MSRKIKQENLFIHYHMTLYYDTSASYILFAFFIILFSTINKNLFLTCLKMRLITIPF